MNTILEFLIWLFCPPLFFIRHLKRGWIWWKCLLITLLSPTILIFVGIVLLIFVGIVVLILMFIGILNQPERKAISYEQVKFKTEEDFRAITELSTFPDIEFVEAERNQYGTEFLKFRFKDSLNIEQMTSLLEGNNTPYSVYWTKTDSCLKFDRGWTPIKGEMVKMPKGIEDNSEEVYMEFTRDSLFVSYNDFDKAMSSEAMSSNSWFPELSEILNNIEYEVTNVSAFYYCESRIIRLDIYLEQPIEEKVYGNLNELPEYASLKEDLGKKYKDSAYTGVVLLGVEIWCIIIDKDHRKIRLCTPEQPFLP